MDHCTSNQNTIAPQPICFYHQLSPVQLIKISRVPSEQLELPSEARPLSPVKSPIPCRICLQTTSEELINPCKCKGTQSFVHISCLKNWILTQKYRSTQKSCELCLTPYNISYTYKLKCRFTPAYWVPLSCIFLLILSVLSSILFYLIRIEPKDPIIFTLLGFFSTISILLTLTSIYLIIQECVYKEINTLIKPKPAENTLDQTTN